MRPKLLYTLFICVLLIGCMTPGGARDANPQGGGAYPIDVYWEEPPVPYMILGQVKGNAPGNTSDETMIVALQREAEKLHAHAIVLPKNGIQVVNTPQGTQKIAFAWAVYYVRKSEDESSPDTPTQIPDEDEIQRQRMELLRSMDQPIQPEQLEQNQL